MAWLLDDGYRQEKKILADRSGVRYLRSYRLSVNENG